MSDIDRFVTCTVDDEDAFGVANANDTTELEMAVIDGSISEEFVRESLEEDSSTQDHGKWHPIEGSAAGSTFGFSVRAGGLGDITGTPDGVYGAEATETPDQTAVGRAILSLFGGVSIITGDLVKSTPTPAVDAFSMEVQTITETDPVILMVDTADDGVQPIPCTIASGVCTPLLQPPSAPTAGGTIYGSINFHLTEALDSELAFQGKFISHTTGHKFRALGAMVNQMVLNLSARKLPKLDFQAMVNGWAVITDSLSPTTPPKSRPWMDAIFRMAEEGTITHADAQLMKVKGDFALTFMRGLQIEDDETHAEGASGYEDPGSESFLKCSPILPYSTAWRTAHAAETAYHMLVTSTRQPGKGMGCYARNMVQSGYPKKVANNGMIRIQPEFMLGSGYTQPGVTFAIF